MNTNLIAQASSADICVEPGLLLRVGPTIFRIEAIHGEIATLQHAITLNDRKIIKLPSLLAQIGKGLVLPANEIDLARGSDNDSFYEDDHQLLAHFPAADLSEAQIKQIRTLLRFITELRKLGYQSLSPKNSTIQLDIQRLHQKFADDTTKVPKAAWIYKWSLEFDKAGGDPRALTPRFEERGGKGKTKTTKEINKAIRTVLDRKKSDKDAKIKTYDVLSDVKSLLQIEYPTRPELSISANWSTVDRRIKDEFSPYEICCRNFGKRFADQKFRDWYPREKAEFPLAVCETDDTDSCVFTVDERSGLPSGRAWITAVIDQHTQVVPGLELSDKPRSTWSAISALVNAILPSDMDSPEFAECSSGCEFYGKPGVIIFDNALYNHAAEIEICASSLGLIPGWAKPFKPTEKSYQEGWNGRLKRDFLPKLPGFRGDKNLRDGLADGMASAAMGLQAFRQALLKWIYDDYSNTPLADGVTARQKWHLGMRYVKPRIPRDIWGHKLVPCLHKTLKLRPEGVLFCGLIYSAPFLIALRKKFGHNVETLFRYNPGNLGEIYVQDPVTKAFAPIPCTNPEYANGLTMYQHKLIRKMCSERKLRNPSIPQLLLLREKLRVLTEELRYSNRLKDRKKSSRTGDVPTDSNTAPSETSSKKDVFVVVTELENTVLDIEEVEMDLEDDGWNLAEAA